MKPSAFFNLSGVKDLVDLKKVLTNTLSNYFQILDKKVGFNDNIDSYIANNVSFTPGAVTKIDHPLGKIPIGFLIIKANNYSGNSFAVGEWTSSSVYIYSDYEMIATVVVLGS